MAYTLKCAIYVTELTVNLLSIGQRNNQEYKNNNTTDLQICIAFTKIHRANSLNDTITLQQKYLAHHGNYIDKIQPPLRSIIQSYHKCNILTAGLAITSGKLHIVTDYNTLYIIKTSIGIQYKPKIRHKLLLQGIIFQTREN